MTMLSMTITVMSTVGGTNTNLISTITGGIMPRTSVKRINTFIEMYGKQDVLTVRRCTVDEPADRYVGGQVADKGYQVNHQVGEDDYVYVCKTLDDTGHCVNCIIFDLPIDASRTGEVT